MPADICQPQFFEVFGVINTCNSYNNLQIESALILELQVFVWYNNLETCFVFYFFFSGFVTDRVCYFADDIEIPQNKANEESDYVKDFFSVFFIPNCIADGSAFTGIQTDQFPDLNQ